MHYFEIPKIYKAFHNLKYGCRNNTYFNIEDVIHWWKMKSYIFSDMLNATRMSTESDVHTTKYLFWCPWGMDRTHWVFYHLCFVLFWLWTEFCSQDEFTDSNFLDDLIFPRQFLMFATHQLDFTVTDSCLKPALVSDWYWYKITRNCVEVIWLAHSIFSLTWTSYKRRIQDMLGATNFSQVITQPSMW